MIMLRSTGLALALSFTMSGAHALGLSVVGASCAPGAPAIPNFSAPALDCGLSPDPKGVFRDDTDNVNIGDPDGLFFSLGISSDPGESLLGGAIAFEVSPGFTGQTMILETTYPSDHLEAAHVYVANDFDWNLASLVGTVDNGAAGTQTITDTLTIAGGGWRYLFLRDASREVYPGTGSWDGFDIDSLRLTEAPVGGGGPAVVPLPLPALMLGTSLLGLGALRRKR